MIQIGVLVSSDVSVLFLNLIFFSISCLYSFAYDFSPYTVQPTFYIFCFLFPFPLCLKASHPSPNNEEAASDNAGGLSNIWHVKCNRPPFLIVQKIEQIGSWFEARRFAAMRFACMRYSGNS